MNDRTQKESARDTLTYEINMLDFCFCRFAREKSLEQSDEDATLENYLYLEGFLLHYRNLIEFLSGKHHSKDDISTKRPRAWIDRELNAEEYRTLAAVRCRAKALDDNYHEVISKHLQHCTLSRSEQKQKWNVKKMKNEMDSIIDEFEQVFGRN